MTLPTYPDIHIRQHGGRREVFCQLRRRYVALTPEEWVRQHFVHWLTADMGYPAALMANEIELRCGDKSLRCDSVLFDTHRQPRLIIEYKAESVPITPKVLTQIATYNMLLHVPHLIVSNGDVHLYLHYSPTLRRWLTECNIPTYEQLANSN